MLRACGPLRCSGSACTRGGGGSGWTGAQVSGVAGWVAGVRGYEHTPKGVDDTARLQGHPPPFKLCFLCSVCG